MDELSVDDAVALVVQLNQDGRAADAEVLCDRVLAVAPQHPDALHFRGLLYFHRDQRGPALEHLQRAAEVAPENAHVHNNLGNLLLAEGHAAEAEACYRRALALQPELMPAYYNRSKALRYLGRTREALDVMYESVMKFPSEPDAYRRTGLLLSTFGRTGEAADVYRRWQLLEPDNPLVAHLLAACVGEAVPERASDGSVVRTFAHAESYDTMMKNIDYRGPALIATAVAEALGTPRAALDVIDLGCGTGLMGPHLRPYARHLTGIDLTPAMLARARERQIYDELEVAELSAYLASSAPARFDLVVSADTLVYIGDLAPVFAGAARVMRPGARLVFSLERHDEAAGAGFKLNPHGRYSHRQDYLRAELVRAGLRPLGFEPVEPRSEGGRPVAGWLVTAAL